MASGAFVSREGLLATTSYALGSAEEVTVRLSGEREFGARVLRRYPLYDLAFIATGVELTRKPAAAPSAMLAENAAFVALAYAGARLPGRLIAGGRGADGHWLATNIAPVQLPDAGGNPLVNENGHLLGILTRNIGAGGKACALKITHVLTLAEQLRRERQLMPKAGYCPALRRFWRGALLFGGGTCETCGARLAASDGRAAQSEELMRLYGENAGTAMPGLRRARGRLCRALPALWLCAGAEGGGLNGALLRTRRGHAGRTGRSVGFVAAGGGGYFGGESAWDPAAARMEVERGYGWNFQRGSALIEVYLTPEEQGYLQVLSPIMHLPASNLLALYRRLLELNLQLTNAALGLHEDVVYLYHERLLAGLDAGRGRRDHSPSGALCR